jgi:hypothetical protein
MNVPTKRTTQTSSRLGLNIKYMVSPRDNVVSPRDPHAPFTQTWVNKRLIKGEATPPPPPSPLPPLVES